MKVSDIVAHLKTRLKDNSLAVENISDEFLIALIELHQNELAAEFECNLASFGKTLDNESELSVDFEINKLICAFLNSQPLNLVSFAFAIRHKNLGNLYFYELSPKKYAFSKAVSGEFELFAVKKAFLTGADDELVLDNSFVNVLVLSVFVNIMRVQVSPDNTARLNYFIQMLNDEKSKMTALLNNRRTQTAFQAPFVRV